VLAAVGLAAYPAAQDIRLQPVALALSAIGVLALVLGLLVRWPAAIGLALVSLGIVPRIARGDAVLDLLRALGETGTLLLQAAALAGLLAQCGLALAGLSRLLAQRIASRFGFCQHCRSLGQLLDPLLEVLAVFDDDLELIFELA
jgi:hypothetical protein